MEKVSLSDNILIKYLFWYLLDVPKEILRGWRNFLIFNLEFFSIFLLLRTFFSPWRRYQWDYGRGFDAWRYFEAFSSNLISRVLGAAMRSVLIVSGIFTEIIIILAGMVIFIGWLFIPIFIFGALFFGMRFLIS